MKQWLWLSQGFTVLMVTILVAAASAISAFVAADQVEKHIDNTISVTVKKAEQQASSAQAKEITNLTNALEKQAIPAIVQECQIIESLHGTCPVVNIQVNP